MIKLEIVNLSGRYMKQVIYIDVLICVNLVINYFLILATSKFLYLRLKRLRLILGEVLGAVYSLYILLPDYPVFVSLIVRLFMATTIMGAVFGFKNFKILAKSVAYFFVVSFLFSGIMFGMWYVFRPKGMAINNGVVYFNISPLLLIASSLVAYTVIEVTNRILEKKENKNLVCSVLVKVGERQVDFMAKVDTCNSLREPFSNLPVIVASEEVLKPVLPQDFQSFIKENEMQNFESKKDFKIRFIPFQTVSGEGLLPAFKPDTIKIKNDFEKEAYIAVCSKEVLPDGTFSLINPLLID